MNSIRLRVFSVVCWLQEEVLLLLVQIDLQALCRTMQAAAFHICCTESESKRSAALSQEYTCSAALSQEYKRSAA